MKRIENIRTLVALYKSCFDKHYLSYNKIDNIDIKTHALYISFAFACAYWYKVIVSIFRATLFLWVEMFNFYLILNFAIFISNY